MSDSLEDRLSGLRTAIADAQQGKARADHELAVAQDREARALQALSEEFGVTSLEHARTELVRREAQLDDACAAAERALEEAGG